ncbi:hypothetical protein JJB98_29290 [Bradyrhizobium diazoefficiens]|nr:hypothetical protein [Bradyrhizobium diazoefficiens]QQO23703.1 hypothetical protein JJB98_29290 [Bradyrhizobium diazoefficiens]
MLVDEQPERLNVLIHIAIGGSGLTLLAAPPIAQRGNLSFEFAHAVAVGTRSCIAPITFFDGGTKSVGELWCAVESRA